MGETRLNDHWHASLYQKPVLEPEWEAARRFHGHLGPWLALGMKMGATAMSLLEARPHFGIRVSVTCHLAPPISCLIDGLQWMTGATYGKQNLQAFEGEPVSVRIERLDTGQAVEMEVLSQTPSAVAAWLAEMGDEAATHHLFDLPANALFSTHEVSAK
jgi:formylmethanofuran dehydrogenase subunit E